MSINKKILLGNKDVITRDIEDIYLDIELSRTINEIRPEKINNNFNLSEQFDKERNKSLKFCVYGTVESKKADATDLDIKITSKDGDYLYSPKIDNSKVIKSKEYTIQTIPLSKNGNLSKNIFGFQKASYYFLFELDRDELEENISGLKTLPYIKYLSLEISNLSKGMYDILEVPFLYIDSNKQIINFGTETTLLDEQGNTVEINNNFPFLYDKHWIKADFNVIRFPYVSFENFNTENILSIKENAGNVDIGVLLDFPSKFGRESVEIKVLEDKTIRNPNDDTSFILNQTTWKIGEQNQIFTINVIDDLYTEGAETITFKLINPSNVEIQEPSTFTLLIEDDDIPSTINFTTISQTTSEGNKTLTINVELDRPIQVPGQHVYVVLNTTQTTATVGSDFENTGNNTFSKQLLFSIGDTSKSFTINIFEDTQYELEEKIVLKLQNPTQNIVIGNKSEHTITIKENIIPKYTTFELHDGTLGSGIFRPLGDSGNSTETIRWQYNGEQDNDVSTDFYFYLKIINKGETPIIYDNKIIEIGNVVYDEKISGQHPFRIGLPSNHVFNNATKQYDKLKYDFMFYSIEGYENENKNKWIINDVTVSAIDIIANSTYYLTTIVKGVKTAFDRNKENCRDNPQEDPIDIIFNGTLFLASNITSGTKIYSRHFSETKTTYDTCPGGYYMLPVKRYFT